MSESAVSSYAPETRCLGTLLSLPGGKRTAAEDPDVGLVSLDVVKECREKCRAASTKEAPAYCRNGRCLLHRRVARRRSKGLLRQHVCRSGVAPLLNHQETTIPAKYALEDVSITSQCLGYATKPHTDPQNIRQSSLSPHSRRCLHVDAAAACCEDRILRVRTIYFVTPRDAPHMNASVVLLPMIEIASRADHSVQPAPSFRAQESYRRCRNPAMNVSYDARTGFEARIGGAGTPEDDDQATPWRRPVRFRVTSVRTPLSAAAIPSSENCRILYYPRGNDHGSALERPLWPTASLATLPAAGYAHVSLLEQHLPAQACPSHALVTRWGSSRRRAPYDAQNDIVSHTVVFVSSILHRLWPYPSDTRFPYGGPSHGSLCGRSL
uniref:Apple domain-containing protein n=1 Tax=Mycena chlorophos TaxID=658473 RepID=A0ABQ0L4B5_MYCCL|nr:predicted protein [Mycena chlorophos]